MREIVCCFVGRSRPNSRERQDFAVALPAARAVSHAPPATTGTRSICPRTILPLPHHAKPDPPTRVCARSPWRATARRTGRPRCLQMRSARGDYWSSDRARYESARRVRQSAVSAVCAASREGRLPSSSVQRPRAWLAPQTPNPGQGRGILRSRTREVRHQVDAPKHTSRLTSTNEVCHRRRDADGIPRCSCDSFRLTPPREPQAAR